MSAQYLAQSIHNRIITDLAVQSILGEPVRAYDSPPEDPVFPYLTYGVLRTEDIGGDELELSRHTVTLHIWSRYSGRLELFEAMEAVHRALTESPISLVDADTALAVRLYSDVLRASDGRTYHGVIRFAFHIQTEGALT